MRTLSKAALLSWKPLHSLLVAIQRSTASLCHSERTFALRTGVRELHSCALAGSRAWLCIPARAKFTQTQKL